MTKVARRAEEWMMQEKSLARRKIVRKTLDTGTFQIGAVAFCGSKIKKRPGSNAQTNYRYIRYFGRKWEQKVVRQAKNMKGTLQGNLFAEPLRLTMLFADIQLHCIVDALQRQQPCSRS